MSNSPAPATTENKPAGAAPVIRGVKGGQQRLSLWLETAEGKKNQLNGKLDDKQIFGFIKARKDDASKKFITLSARNAEGGYDQVAIGNPVNSRGDDEPVYFDSFVFHIGKGDDEDTLGARLTKSATDEFAKEVGFTSARVARPAKESTASADAKAAEPAAAQAEEASPSF
jgi:hypothetical protein